MTDLNIQPLRRAELNLKENGFADRADFLLTDGIPEALPYQVDAYVIAGMGGETIAGILSRAIARLPLHTCFVLQPMSRAQLLRRFLYEHGFRVEGEQAIGENGKIFLIFRAILDGVSRRREDSFFVLGEYLPRQKGEAVSAYWRSCLLKIRSKIDGKRKAGLPVLQEKREEMLYLAQLEEQNENS